MVNENDLKIKANEKLRAPYTSPGQAKAILELFNRMTPKRIDSKFITNQKITTASNAFRVIDFLKWIGLINEKGEVIENKSGKLRLVGDEKKKFIKNLIEDSYKEIFEMYDVEKIEKNDIINFFISEYGFGLPQSIQATRLFIYLCKEYNIPLNKKILESAETPKRVDKRVLRKRISKKKSPERVHIKDDTEINKGLLLSIKTASTKFEKKFETLSEFENFLDKEWKARVNSWKLDLLEYSDVGPVKEDENETN